MTTVTLGKIDAGGVFEIDVDRLVETRLMIQANSGAGKSWAIRKLLEVTHGKVQHIVIDKEGEYNSLRESFDYVLAGKGGDVPADLRSAELLAKKTLELGVSLIVDLSELKRDQRETFVKAFLEALVDAPRKQWRPALVVIDECDVFAPEGGKSESLKAVVDVAARGRKRGLALVVATQRISKLSKDVCAEALNKFIGRTSLDLDMRRAAGELGMSPKDMVALRDLESGQFHVFGPAIGKKVELARIGKVKTSHGRKGKQEKAKPPAPTSKIRKVLAQLADLPAEAQQELQDKGALKARVRELEQALKAKAAGAPDPKALERARLDGIKEGMAKMRSEIEKAAAELQSVITSAVRGFKERLIAASQGKAPTAARPAAAAAARSASPAPRPPVERSARAVPASTGDWNLGKCERAILRFLVMSPNKSFTKTQVGAMTGYSGNSGNFGNAVTKLANVGLVKRAGQGIQVVDQAHAVDALGGDVGELDPRKALEEWLGRLGKAPRAIYEQLLSDPREWTKAELGDATGYASDSGNFNNAIGSLCTLGLAVRKGSGVVALNPELTELG